MKIKSLGARGNILTQISRIEDGFLSLGHELVNDSEPQFIYCNDKGVHQEGIELKKKYPKAKLILNTLDLAQHCEEHRDICDQLSLNFYFADAITTISETVKEQMLSAFPHTQKAGISVVYQPIKSVKPLKLEKNGKMAVFGRQLDKNKNFPLAMNAAIIANMDIDVIGPEDPTTFSLKHDKNYKRCYYKGLVSDKQLNIEYNEASVVLMCSGIEGIGLSMIESLCVKTPVVCVSTMSTSKEFAPPEFICEPNPFAIADKIKYVTSGDEKISKILDEYSERYLKIFSPESVANNIVSVYEKIK